MSYIELYHPTFHHRWSKQSTVSTFFGFWSASHGRHSGRWGHAGRSRSRHVPHRTSVGTRPEILLPARWSCHESASSYYSPSERLHNLLRHSRQPELYSQIPSDHGYNQSFLPCS